MMLIKKIKMNGDDGWRRRWKSNPDLIKKKFFIFYFLTDDVDWEKKYNGDDDWRLKKKMEIKPRSSKKETTWKRQ